MKISRFNKVFSFSLLCFAMLFAFSVVGVPTKAEESTEIGSVADFNNFVESGSSGNITLTNDIIFDDFASGIGSSSNKFSGVFDGNGHSVTANYATTGGTIGFINNADGASVKNLTIKMNVTIDASKPTYLGGLIGYAKNVSLENCAIYLDVNIANANGNIYIGGIFGRDMGGNTVTNCAVYATFSGEGAEFDVCAGKVSNADNEASYDKVVLYNATSGIVKINNTETAITSTNSTDLVASLGENWSICSTCGLIFASFDKIHNCVNDNSNGGGQGTENEITSVTPRLNKTEYAYSASVPVLDFESISKANANDDVEFSYNFDKTAVGEYSVEVGLVGADADKYKLESNIVDFKIIPLDITLEISNQSSVYGEVIKPINYVVSGNNGLDCAVEFALKLNDEIPENYNAGTYKIVPIITDENFNLTSYNDANYVIEHREISLKNDTFSKIYDGLDFEPVLEFENVLDGDKTALYYQFTTPLPQNCDTYTLNFALTGSFAQNYKLAKTFVTAVISPLELTVSWSGDNFTFNNSAVSPVADVELNLPNITKPILTVEGSAVYAGSHTAICSTSNKNFTLTNTEFKFQINPYKASAKWSGESFKFDNTPHCPSATVILPFVYDFELSVSGEKINAGNYTATILENDENIELANYSFDFSITQLVCTAEWGNCEFVYNGEPQAPSCRVSVPLENYFPQFNLEYGGSDANSYVASVTTTDANIRIDNASTNYVIKPYEITLTYSNTTLTFDGTSQLPTFAYAVPDFASELSINLTGSKINVGKYNATATCDSTNFKIKNAVCEFEIIAREVAVEWSNLVFEFDSSAHFPTYKLGSDIDYEVVIYTNIPNVNAGVYVASVFTDDVNINLTNSTASYEIKPASINLIWSNTTHTFDGTAFSPNVSVACDFDYNFSVNVNGAQTNAGRYTATAVCNDSNIKLCNVSVNFEILPQNIKIEWGELEFLYNGYIIRPEISFKSNFVFEVSVSASGLDVGEYVATAVCHNPNFNLINSTANYTISPRRCSVEFENTTLCYTGEIIAPTAKVVLDADMNPNCAPEVYIEEGATAIGLHTAKAKTNSANFILENNICEFEIVPSEIKFENEIGGICVLGEINKNSNLMLENVTELIGQSVGKDGKVIQAIKISLENEAVFYQDENIYHYTLDIEQLPTNFTVCSYDDETKEFNNLNYAYCDNQISFSMGSNGIVCILSIEERLSAISVFGITITCVVVVSFLCSVVLFSIKRKQ